MRLLGVEASDFLSYRRLDVDLSDVHQLAIVGRNGHGKSAILDAILWCLFAKGRGSSDEMVREGASSSWVRTTWERTVRGQPTTVVITRSRSRESDESSLSVQIDGEEKSKSKIPLTQAYVEYLVGMGPKAMMAGPVMVQGDSAALLEAQPSARKDLLVELFQLERWEGYHDEAKRRRKTVQVEQDRLARELLEIDTQDFDEVAINREITHGKARLAEISAELDHLREQVTTLREQAAVYTERSRQASELQAQADAALATASSMEASRNRLLRGIADATARSRRAAPDVPPEPSEDQVLAIRAQIEELDTVLAARKAAQAQLAPLQRSRARLSEAATKASPCDGNPPGCQYLLAAAQAKVELAEVDEQIANLTDLTSSLEATVNKRAHLVVDLRAEERIVKQAMAEHVRVATVRASVLADVEASNRYLADAQPEADRLAREIAAAKDIHAQTTAKVMRLRQDEYAMADLADQIRTLTQDATALREQGDLLQASVNTALQYRDEMVKVLAKRSLLVAQDAELAKQAATLDVLVKAFHRDGIPTLILETALPEIEGRANDVLARLPDDYSIRLDTKKATKSGTFKDELGVTVLTGGRDRPYHMLSGGQRFRVDFAMRIALASVIASRVEATVDTLWLDEPLGPLDREGQEAVADTISAVADDFGLIAVVSHVPDFNDRFESKLAVSMEDGESRAVLA
jgi:exonuclease SbcC